MNRLHHALKAHGVDSKMWVNEAFIESEDTFVRGASGRLVDRLGQ